MLSPAQFERRTGLLLALLLLLLTIAACAGVGSKANTHRHFPEERPQPRHWQPGKEVARG